MRIGQHLAMTVSTASIAAILLIATVGGLAIDSRPILTVTIRSAARHHHDPALHPMPGPSTSSDLLADANNTILAFASIIAAADTLAIEPSPIPLGEFRPVVHHRLSSEPDSLPDPSVPLDIFADANATILASASIIAATDTLAIELNPIPLAKS